MALCMKKYSCNNLKVIYKNALEIKYVDSYIFYTIKLNNLLKYGMNKWIFFYWGLASPKVKLTPTYMFDELVQFFCS